jgi:hypothetical protein
MAVETPTIFPVPRVAARVVARVAKTDIWVSSVSPSGVTERRMAFPIFLWGKNFRVK